MTVSELPPEARLDYEYIAKAGATFSGDALTDWLWNEIAYGAHDLYRECTPRQTAIVRISHGTFEYIYDDYASLEAQGLVPQHPTMEARLVIAIGRTALRMRVRDDSRLRNWAGPKIRAQYGPGWDRGHFIGYCLGGVVDGFEANVFVQRTSLNRGWKAHPRGRLYRAMEDYCAAHLGTFCFNRPVYRDETAKPAFIEFGILKSTGELWVECFDNR